MALHHYSPLSTTESLSHQRSSKKPPINSSGLRTHRQSSLKFSGVSIPPVTNACVQLRSMRTMEQSTADNHSMQSAINMANTTAVAREPGVDSGVAIGDDKTDGEKDVDYDSIITAILSANKQREMDTRHNKRVDSRPISAKNSAGPSRRKLRSHCVKCSPIIRNTRKGEVVDLDEDTPYPLQPIFDDNFNTQYIQDSYCVSLTDNDFACLSTQVGLDDYSEDFVVNISEPQHCSHHNEVKFYPFRQLHYSDPSNSNTDSPSKQSFTSANLLSNDKSNPFLQTYFDPCDIDTDSVPSPTRPSLNSKTPTEREFLVLPSEDTTPNWMQLDEYANIQSLRAPDGVTGVLYTDDIFSELLA
ncbi:hypothetical protein V1520DRAFT_296931 [Lipomyces starkeyi]|uniref:Uncharacterized protein n=1 Tax=Lipomyces starkeyi NRRL Y-11557 TaxID=675824 RepID=A0A1E3Q193_LIPST|nr:hypothetical protein LIPSTDRAFT_74289 [Lipomyces starkeyi NRRL Y-11557]